MEYALDEHELSKAQSMVDAMPADEVLIARLDQSNQVSLNDGQVEHGYAHATDVLGITDAIIARVEQLFPGTFTPAHKLSARAGALLHDSGRSVAVKDHDKHGARIAHEYLNDLAVRLFGSVEECPRRFRQRVVILVRKHRSDSWLYRTPEEKARRQKELDGPDIAALLIADKLCGSEVRVPEEKMALLRSLKKLTLRKKLRDRYGLDANWSLARINWNNPDMITEPAAVVDAARALLKRKGIEIPPTLEIDQHDRVNGSIASRTIEIFADQEVSKTSKFKGTLLLRLNVAEGIAPQELVTGLDWWHDAFHTASKAAKYLGLRFRIDFNGRTLEYDRVKKNWVRVGEIHA